MSKGKRAAAAEEEGSDEEEPEVIHADVFQKARGWSQFPLLHLFYSIAVRFSPSARFFLPGLKCIPSEHYLRRVCLPSGFFECQMKWRKSGTSAAVSARSIV